jgi:hypothetical protein
VAGILTFNGVLLTTFYNRKYLSRFYLQRVYAPEQNKNRQEAGGHYECQDYSGQEDRRYSTSERAVFGVHAMGLFHVEPNIRVKI